MSENYFKNKYLVSIYIFVFSFLIFSPSLNNGFIWDDVIEIERNYHQFRNSSFKKSLMPSLAERKISSYYRPFVRLSMYYDFKIWSQNPLGYHITNVVLYSFCSILIYFLFLLILKRFGTQQSEIIALFSTGLFVVHPMHVESVSWIVGRTDIICSLFFIGAFMSHIRSKNNLYFFPLTVVLFYSSLLSKEIAIAFPFVILAFDVLSEKRLSKRSLAMFVIYILLVLLYLHIRSRAHQNLPKLSTHISSGNATSVLHYFDIIKTMFSAYMFYFIKLLFPFKFNAFVSHIPHGFIYFLLSILAFALLSIIFVYSVLKKTGLKAFCIISLLLILGPSVLVAIFKVASTPLAERYLFLPIAPFSLIAVYSLFKFSEHVSLERSIKIAGFLFLLLLIFFTISRQSIWGDRLTFWADASSKSTDIAIPYINYGMALIEDGKIDEGIKQLENGLNPELKSARVVKAAAANNLGIAYLNKGKNNIAEKWFNKGIEFDSRFHKSYFHLGLIHFHRGKNRGSREELEMAEFFSKIAIERDEKYARAYLLLAKVYVEYGEIDKAKEFAGIAVKHGLTHPLDRQAEKILKMY